jgi:hypothetical protein
VSDESLEECEERLFASGRAERPRRAVRERVLNELVARRARRPSWRPRVAFGAFAAAAALALLASATRTPPPGIDAERLPPGLARPSRDAAAEVTSQPRVRLSELPPAPAESASVAPHRDRAPASRPSASAVAPMTLEDETSALERVQNALRNGEPRAALLALEEYEREARAKHLGAEAQILKIQALAASGQNQAASTLAERFVGRYPNSPLVDRARKYLTVVDAGGTTDGGRETNGETGR